MKISNLKKAFFSKWLNVYEATFNNNGKEGIWFFASRDGNKTLESKDKCAAVVIVPKYIHEDGTHSFVLIREFRVPLLGYEWSFPAGLIDDEDTPEYTAIRELKEETGLAVTKILKVSPPIYSSAGLTDESVQVVFVECNGDLTKENNESSECIDAYILSLEEIVELFNRKDVKISARTWCLFNGIVG